MPAHPDNAYRLLREQEQLVLVFPEGTKGTGKLYGERYQLRRFGRGGFVEIAMRAGVPVVPIAVVGRRGVDADPLEEPRPRQAAGRPVRADHRQHARLRAARAARWRADFPAKFKLRVLDPVHFDVEPDQPRYSRSRVMDESERIRQQIQDALLRHAPPTRESVWFG